MKVMWLAGVLVLATVPAFAQQEGGAVPVPTPQTSVSSRTVRGGLSPAQARFQMRVMESVLENAVQQGAQALSAQLRRVSPGVTLFSGPVRARGFRLGDYGYFFAVDVPALHRSVTWTVRTLAQANGDVSRALQSFRRVVQAQNDPRSKKELEQALRLLELQVGPQPRTDAGAEPVMVASSQEARERAAAAVAVPPDAMPAILQDPLVTNPDTAYTSAVQGALVDAMVDYGVTLGLAADEWLTVAARENRDSVVAGDLTDSVTITLRVKGSDLDAFRGGRLTRDECYRRVEVREF